MKYSCDVIKDLLPLYYDKACSEQSKKIVEEHLEECASCRSLMKKLQDNTYENCLHDEKEDIIKNYTRSIKKKALFAGFIVVAITLLTCFIANLATGNTLDWFFYRADLPAGFGLHHCRTHDGGKKEGAVDLWKLCRQFVPAAFDLLPV